MYTLNYTRYRWIPLVSLGFALLGGVLWTLAGITWKAIPAITALQMSLVLPCLRAQAMAHHWKRQLGDSIRLAHTIVTRLNLSPGREEIEAALKEVQGD